MGGRSSTVSTSPLPRSWSIKGLSESGIVQRSENGQRPVDLAHRFADRVGKGIRGAPRDALIADLRERASIDPALAGSVLLTTVTDVVGFMAFLGLATVFLV